MSARAERRRHARGPRGPRHLHSPPELNDDGIYGVQPGWFQSLDDLDHAKQSSHDALIATMGDRRTGGVQWRWWTGQEAHQVLAMLRTDKLEVEDEHTANTYRRIAAHLREYGGYLIVAMAEGTPPEGVTAK